MKDQGGLDKEEEEEERGIAVGGTAGVKLRQWERRAVSGAVTSRVSLDWMLHTGRGQGGAKLAVHGPYMAPRCVVLCHSVKQLNVSRTFHISSFF